MDLGKVYSKGIEKCLNPYEFIFVIGAFFLRFIEVQLKLGLLSCKGVVGILRVFDTEQNDWDVE